MSDENHGFVVVPTDTSGIVEWDANQSVACTVELVAFLTVT
jgi:hypothetical protein